MTGILDRLAAIYIHKANGRYGLTDVRQQQHALQAATLAEANHEPPSLIAASFLHDVGHMIHDLGEDVAQQGVDDNHEGRAAIWLAGYFGPEVTEPIRLHVAAKRYLCSVEPAYFKTLAPDSVLSLRLQGGPMSVSETTEFTQVPYAKEAVRLRRYDDLAKRPDAVTPSVEHFLSYLEALLK